MTKKRLIPLSIAAAMIFGISSVNAETGGKVRIGKKLATSNSVGDSPEKNTSPVTYDRIAKYQSIQTSENLDAQYQSYISLNKNSLNINKKRSQKSSNKHGGSLYIYDAAVFLKTDIDGDGYYSEIRVDFDVDTSVVAYRDVFAELYIREEGTSQWTHYYTTDVFQIYSDDSSDDYSVTTGFNDGFPTGKYEIAIDLFEYGYTGVVHTLDAVKDPDLGNLPIEDVSFEQVQPVTNVSISTVKTEIFTDNDGDGYYQDFKISFDADVSSGQRSVVAKLYQKTGNGDWQYETQSDTFTIDGTSTADTMAFEATWQSGYATSYYDFKIEIYDSATNEFLVSASSDFGPLVDVPLEDAGKDQSSGSSGSGSGSSNNAPSTTSSGSGGGSWNLMGLLLLTVAGMIRRKN